MHQTSSHSGISTGSNSSGTPTFILADKNSHCWFKGKGGYRLRVPAIWREMGCALSASGVTPDPTISEEKKCPSLEGGLDVSEETERRCDGGVPEPFPLSESQKELIEESWKILHKDIARVGIIVFIRLFETHPECKDAFFLFRDIDDLQQLKMSKELQAHGLRVMSFIEKSVARLDQKDKLEHLAFDLGRSHFRYKAPPKYYEYIGAQFIQAVQPILKEDWTPEVEKAWESLFRYLAAAMRRGFYKEEKMMEGNQSLPSRKAGGGESTPNKV
ncbi:cytoglobin-1-like isoform X2 [Rhineura floridana]|uniref:cytoglobin-1-like isoform X2 n=1 Tax=Rhineura floridana TaxID=261503 RepID=UPI002AC8364A|nr:cytoglobin-1-like isoform X2 [Rhineura floridana]